MWDSSDTCPSGGTGCDGKFCGRKGILHEGKFEVAGTPGADPACLTQQKNGLQTSTLLAVMSDHFRSKFHALGFKWLQRSFLDREFVG